MSTATRVHSNRGGFGDKTESYPVGQLSRAWRPGGKPKPSARCRPAWAQIIDDYMLTLAAAGQPAASLTLRRIQLVRMARDLGGAPADVTADTLVAWFGAQTGWKTETRRELPRRGARLLAVGISHQEGA